MIAAGLKPLEVLRLATVNAAKWRGRTEQEGSIAAGKQADLVLLRANPLEDIRRTREIDGLVLRGRYLSRAELDGLLEKAAARVSASQPPR